MSGLEVAATGMTGLAAKSTAVLCLALALAWLARRGSARTLHLLWTTTFVVLLALPVVNLAGPSWAVPILPVRDANADELSLEMTAEETSASGVERAMPGLPISSESPSAIARSRTSSGSLAFESELLAPVASGFPTPLSPSTIAFIIWALGCGAALTSLAVGGLRFRGLVRKAVPVRDPNWLSQGDSIRRRVRVRGDVRILLSTEASTPMTGGLRRPLIVLPSSAEDWTPDRREVVLTHELVHVRRRDALRHLLGRVAAACYWFHPLGWLAWRLSATAGERSCDEEVVALGARPSQYARHLFSLASETTGGPTVLACRMVPRSQLEDRIRSILRQDRPRYSPVRTSAALAAIGVAGTLVACGNPVPREPAARPSPRVETPASNDARAEEPSIYAPAPEPTPLSNPGQEPPTAESVEAERLAATSTASERRPPAPPATDAPPTGLRNVGQAFAALLTPEAVRPQAFQCNPGNSITILRQRGEWTLQRHVNGVRVCMRNHGNVEIGSQQVATGSAGDGRWLVLESQAERLHRLVVTPGPGGLRYDWSINGRSEVFDAQAAEWRDRMLTVAQGYLEVQDVLAAEGSLRSEIGSHRRHVADLQRQIWAHHRHVSSLHREIGAYRRHVNSLQRQLTSTDSGVQGTGQRMAQTSSVGMEEALRATTQSLERQLESATFALAGDIDEIRLREMQEEVQGTVADLVRLQDEIETQLVDMEAETDRMERESRVMQQIIEQFDLDERVREIEQQIEEYDLEGQMREIELQIEEYDLDGKIAEIESQIEEFDADRRIDEIERSLQDEVAALRRIIG
jgi:beta-lactamase regulating signal transducer with metallopeptidase domain